MTQSLKDAATLALKHTGKGTWDASGRIVIGSVDTRGLKSFCVASVDDDDELPVCAGEAIAEYIAEAHPAAVLALIAENERLTAENHGLAAALDVADDELEHEPYCRACGRVECSCDPDAEAADEEASA